MAGAVIVGPPMDAIEMQKKMQQLIARGASGQELADFAEDIAERAHDDSQRTALVMAAVGAVVLSVVSLAALVGAISTLLSRSGSSDALGTAAGFGVMALVMGLFGALLTRNALALRLPPRELAKTGIAARLTIRDYRQAPGGFRLQSNGSSVNFQRVAIDLDVAPAEGAPYTVTVREYLAGRAYVKLAPGAKLVGYIDRARPDRIFIDWRARTGT